MINKNRLINLTKELIRINSENPPGRELEIAKYVSLIMRRAGFKIINSYTFEKNRPNIIGILKGNNGSKSLLLSPHLDTVPAGKNWEHNPFKPVLVNGLLFGRGATDCKCNLAVCLEVCRSLLEDKFNFKFDLIIAASADEETGSKQGMIKLLDKKILKPDCALILDSDDFRVVICQKGLIHFKVKIFGTKAHGAYPDRGVNAIEITAKIICDLKNMHFKFKKHPLLKPPTVNIGKISGGEKVNVVADFCEFEVDLRFLPGMDPRAILKQIKKIIRSRAKRFSLQIDSIQQPYEISKNHYLIKGLLNSDKRFKLGGSEGATVITFFKKHNIPAAATGFGSGGTAHSADEFVSVDNLCKGALALEKFIKNFSLK